MNTGRNDKSGSQDVESSEDDTDLSPDNIGSLEEIPEDTILSRQTSLNLVPFIGQRFVSQDAAYEFYCSFAKQCGFSIRRHRTRGKDGVGRGVTRRDFACHRGGFPQAKPTEEGKLQRKRKSSRCGCRAYMRIVRRADFDVPEWRVTGFSNNHNHELVKSMDVHIVPFHGTFSSDDKSRICMFAKAGMSVRQMLRLLELEKGVRLGCLPFTELDVRNLVQSFRYVGKDHDPIDLISMCKKFKDEHRDFKYEFKLDGHNRLEHIAWSYGLSVEQYGRYGDAVLFDTTHRVDAYDMLLRLWIGVDNHGMACLFGCVLFRDENPFSFGWSLKTFLSFMGGKAPQTILTDHNTWLKEAIARELPETKHAFSIWRIVANFSEWFSILLGSRYDDWKADFFRLYNWEMIEDFESGWKEMVDRYGLHSNKHIISLYALRNFWALSFLRRYFFAGLMNKSMSDSINAFIRRILSAQSDLNCFVDKVANVAEYSDQVGAKHKMQQKSHRVALKTGSPMETHVATMLTPYAFSMIQEELVLAPQFASVMVDEGCFHVRHHARMDELCKVTWDTHQEMIRCSCRQFEFIGILCRHILRVLSTNNCFHIPDQYLPFRWRLVGPPMKPFQTKEQVERVQFMESLASSIITESVETEERLDVACEQMSLVLSHIKQLPHLNDHHRHHHCNEIGFSSQSGPLILPEVEDSEGIVQGFALGSLHESLLGKLKERKPNAELDMSRKRRRCSIPSCVQFGHDASDCPVIASASMNGDGDSLGFL